MILDKKISPLEATSKAENQQGRRPFDLYSLNIIAILALTVNGGVGAKVC